MTANRKTLRAAVATALSYHLPSAQVVYAYGKAQFGAQTPVVVVTSAGSERQRISMRETRLTAMFDIHTFVLHRDGASWTEQQAEDALDDLENQIALFVDQNRATESWHDLGYAGATNARDTVVLEGIAYLHEVVSLAVQE